MQFTLDFLRNQLMQHSEHFAHKPRKQNLISFNDKWENHKSTFLKDEFWSAIRHQISLMKFPANIDSMYAASSLTLRTKDLKTSVKITSSGEVLVERKISKLKFKSEISRHTTIKESVEHFVSALQQHLQISLAS